VGQVVERLLCKWKALSSNSSPTKKKKGIQKREIQTASGRMQANAGYSKDVLGVLCYSYIHQLIIFTKFGHFQSSFL
jgi:hypothetical protein